MSPRDAPFRRRVPSVARCSKVAATAKTRNAISVDLALRSSGPRLEARGGGVRVEDRVASVERRIGRRELRPGVRAASLSAGPGGRRARGGEGGGVGWGALEARGAALQAGQPPYGGAGLPARRLYRVVRRRRH